MTELDWTSLADVVEHPIGASNDNLGLDGGGYAISVRGLRARPGFIEGLGVRVVAGQAATTVFRSWIWNTRR